MSASLTFLERFKAVYASKSDSWSVSILEVFLKREFEEIEGEHAGQSMRIFVPLCGKSPDIYWLVDKGHIVVGVEWVEEAVKDLFQERAIPYSVKQVIVGGSNVPLYTSDDQRISVFVADFFLFKEHSLVTLTSFGITQHSLLFLMSEWSTTLRS